MNTNGTPESANAHQFVRMEKTELLSVLEKAYADAKPINDSIVDISLRVQAITAEIYRRSIIKHLPGIPVGRRRTIMKVDTRVHPNKGLPAIVQRIAQLQQENIEITAVEYDENTGEYSFFTDPEFNIEEPKS